MCLVVFGISVHPGYELILGANRDEFLDRPTAAAEYWSDRPGILAGRDLLRGGAWLGITGTGRIALVTNFRDGAGRKPSQRSRGLLVRDFLQNSPDPIGFLESVHRSPRAWSGFNLVLGANGRYYHYSNRECRIRPLKPGLYGLSNHLLDTPWPKVKKAKSAAARLIRAQTPLRPENVFDLLHDRTPFPDNRLPQTGVGLTWERILSPAFVTSPGYGTRSSTVVLKKNIGTTVFVERSFDRDFRLVETRQFTLNPARS